MPPQSTEVLRRFYEAWNASDVAALLEVVHPDAEFWPLMVPLVSSEVYRGRDGVARWVGDLQRRFASVRCEPEQILDLGEEVVCILRIVARDGDGTELDARLANVCRLRDGLIVEFEGRDADETLAELDGAAP